jgi:hypothetical protein
MKVSYLCTTVIKRIAPLSGFFWNVTATFDVAISFEDPKTLKMSII